MTMPSECLRTTIDLSSERAVVGYALNHCRTIPGINSDHFSEPTYRRIYRVASRLESRGAFSLPEVRLALRGKDGGDSISAELLANLSYEAPPSHLIQQFSDHLLRLGRVRQGVAEADAYSRALLDGEYARAHEHLEAAAAVLKPPTERGRDGGELDLHELARTGEDPEPVRYLFRDANGEGPLVDGDIVVLAAEGEGGKSTFTLGACLSLATGADFAERFSVVDPMPVLYYDGENNERLIQRRWLRMLNGNPAAKEAVLGWDSSQFRYRWRGNLTLDKPADRDHIVARCGEYGTRVLVLDTQIRFTAGDLTNARDAAALYGYLSEIKRRADLRLVILLAHLRKRQGNGGINDLGQRLYGSVDIRNSCDCLIVLAKTPDAGVTVVHEKTRWDQHYPNFAVELIEDGPEAIRLVAGDAVNCPTSTIRFVLEESERAGVLRQEIITAVAQAFPDMKPAAVTKAVSRELKSRYYASKPEGKATRYWLRMYAPEDAA